MALRLKYFRRLNCYWHLSSVPSFISRSSSPVYSISRFNESYAQIPSSNLHYYQFAFRPTLHTRTFPQTQIHEQKNEASSICTLAFHSNAPLIPRSWTMSMSIQRIPSGYADGDANANALERNDCPFPDIDRDCSPTSRWATALPPSNSANADGSFPGWERSSCIRSSL